MAARVIAKRARAASRSIIEPLFLISRWAEQRIRSGVTRHALSKYGEEQEAQYHQHRKRPGQQDGDDNRVPEKGVDVALSDRLHEVQAGAAELVPQLAEDDWRPMLGVDPDQPIAHQHGGACERNDPADQAPDDQRRTPPPASAAKIIRPIASATRFPTAVACHRTATLTYGEHSADNYAVQGVHRQGAERPPARRCARC